MSGILLYDIDYRASLVQEALVEVKSMHPYDADEGVLMGLADEVVVLHECIEVAYRHDSVILGDAFQEMIESCMVSYLATLILKFRQTEANADISAEWLGLDRWTLKAWQDKTMTSEQTEAMATCAQWWSLMEKRREELSK